MTARPALIRRDSFAREELTRVLVPAGDRKPCQWCGNRPGRFVYRTETDGGRISEHSGAFCSVDCHDSFHSA